MVILLLLIKDQFYLSHPTSPPTKTQPNLFVAVC